MKKITIDQLPGRLARLPEQPRVVVSGNFATPHTLLTAVDQQSADLHPAHAQRAG